MKRLDVAEIRARIAEVKGPEFWRSLDELANASDLDDLIENEFPKQPGAQVGMQRREFLALMSTSIAAATLGGLTGCAATKPESIIPYVRQPEDLVPGKPLFFATAMPLSGYATGLLGVSQMGRPTKVEGNPDHPDSLGATHAFAQASVFSLYDPERSQVITNLGRIATWDSFVGVLNPEIESARLDGGGKLRILTENLTSPTLVDQLQQLLKVFPSARWHQYEPAGFDNCRAGAKAFFGQYADTLYHFDRADVILSLDADFLSLSPAHLRHAREFAQRRSGSGSGTLSRLYVLESTPSITGAKADHRIPIRSSDILSAAKAVAAQFEKGAPAGTSASEEWIAVVGRDLQAHLGSSLVIAGPWQPPEVHALAHAMNAQLGNVGKTVEYTDPVEPNPVDHVQSLTQLVEDMQRGAVGLLLILGGNPVYTSPADLEFRNHLGNVPLRIHLSSYDNETTEVCHWHIPETYYLESWGDIRASTGVATIQQPLINPLYATKSAHEVLSAFLGEPTRSTYEIIREFWKGHSSGQDFELFWRKAVHDGVVPESAESRRANVSATTAINRDAPQAEIRNPQSEIEVVFRPDPTIFDGRFSNNAWLQELPKPLTKLTWDNPALLSPATAERLGVANEDVIEIRHEGRTVHAPVWISPGHARDSITLFLGYGRTRAGRHGSNRGYNAYAIRTSASQWTAQNVEVRKTGERYQLVSTQQHQLMENRDLVRSGTAEEYRAAPPPSDQSSLYPEFAPEEYAWGMAIDLSACVGCNACVVACQAENNIPTVGKDEVANSRQMHWLRIDTYYKGSVDSPEMFFQPVPCMHCENAPCEPVCPVAATTHSVEGLNEMTYNRCVGTRYCSNNCPYKVRRFNFYQYANWDVPSLKLLQNPDVTVRSRGVMEKCTYCVQRINRARINAEKEDRLIGPNEVQTACQAVCPAEAIVFGDIRNSESRVSKLKREPRNYSLLEELNTKPRTTYLARLVNPNPELS